MSRKIIGIPGWKLGENSFGCTVTYLDFISKFGDPRVIMPWEDKFEVDAILMPGGPDADPGTYGHPVGYFTQSPCIHRQAFANKHLRSIIDSGVPVFGICLGMQMINIALDGTVTQHLYYHDQSEIRGKVAHPITILKNLVYKHEGKYEVNSHHHQGVTEQDLSKDVNVVATTYNHEDVGNRLVEAFLHHTLPVAAVQWHPEEIHDALAYSLFDYILR